jgi:hypothetical protein
MMVSVGCPRVWCLKNTRFWFPLPTSRISGLAVDLSFSCHPRHRSWGRPVVSHIPKDDQNVSRRLPLSRHGFVVIIPMQNIRSSIPYSKRQAQSKQKWYLVTWSSIHEKKSSGVIGYTQEWWQTTHCFPDFYYDQQFGWCGVCQFHIFSCYISIIDR